MSIALAVRKYVSDAKADLNTIALATCAPISKRAAVGMTGVAAAATMFMNMTYVFAATPLFDKLNSAVTALYNDAESMVSTVATFALVICIIGIFIASMFGPKATATMTSALKMVVGFFIFWQLVPVIISTIEQLFGSGKKTAGGGVGDADV